MGIAQRGSNRSNAMTVKKGKWIPVKRVADRPICQAHQDHIESKEPPLDRRQMHALKWLVQVEAESGDVQGVIVNVHKTHRFGYHVFTNSPCLLQV